jgi:hypothetical protein
MNAPLADANRVFWLLLLAFVVAILSRGLRVPYAVSLVLGQGGLDGGVDLGGGDAGPGQGCGNRVRLPDEQPRLPHRRDLWTLLSGG